MQYRTATAQDAAAVAALHAESWRAHYRGAFADAYLDGDLLGERLEVWRGRLERPTGARHVLLACEAQQLLGFVCVHGDHDAVWGSLVDNLHVVGSAKRRGIGRGLLRRAGAWLAGRYPQLGVYLLVLERNDDARRFYERLGGRCAETATMESHGGAVVRSCRYVWPSAADLARA